MVRLLKQNATQSICSRCEKHTRQRKPSSRVPGQPHVQLHRQNSVEAASDDTSALIKKAVVDAAGQHQGYDVLRHSIRTHREQLGFRDSAGFSVGIPLSSRNYTSTTVWLQGLYCLDNCTNFFDNCAFYMLQLYRPGSSLSSSVGG